MMREVCTYRARARDVTISSMRRERLLMVMRGTASLPQTTLTHHSRSAGSSDSLTSPPGGQNAQHFRSAAKASDPLNPGSHYQSPKPHTRLSRKRNASGQGPMECVPSTPRHPDTMLCIAPSYCPRDHSKLPPIWVVCRSRGG